MVFVWSYLTDGDGPYTLAQVAINDIIMVLAFAPIVMLLVGVSGVHIPGQVLLTSVIVFSVVPLSGGALSRVTLIKTKGLSWFESAFLPIFRPVTIVALLATLVLIFAFQAEKILTKWTVVLLLAIPILIQVYFNSGLTYGLMRFFNVPHTAGLHFLATSGLTCGHFAANGEGGESSQHTLAIQTYNCNATQSSNCGHIHNEYGATQPALSPANIY
jgi:ACR3 family arsenite efflux pump ArsB